MFPDCEKFPTDDLVHGMEMKSAWPERTRMFLVNWALAIPMHGECHQDWPKKKSDMSICQFLVEYPMAQEAGGIATEVWFQLRWKVHEIHAVRPLFIFAQRAHLESLLAALWCPSHCDQDMQITEILHSFCNWDNCFYFVLCVLSVSFCEDAVDVLKSKERFMGLDTLQLQWTAVDCRSAWQETQPPSPPPDKPLEPSLPSQPSKPSELSKTTDANELELDTWQTWHTEKLNRSVCFESRLNRKVLHWFVIRILSKSKETLDRLESQEATLVYLLLFWCQVCFWYLVTSQSTGD